MKAYNLEIVKRILDEMPSEKKRVLGKALDRNMILTSARVLSGCTLEIFKEGWRVTLHGTRCSFSVFVKDDDGGFIFTRMPSRSKLHLLWVEWTSMNECDYEGF